MLLWILRGFFGAMMIGLAILGFRVVGCLRWHGTRRAYLSIIKHRTEDFFSITVPLADQFPSLEKYFAQKW